MDVSGERYLWLGVIEQMLLDATTVRNFRTKNGVASPSRAEAAQAINWIMGDGCLEVCDLAGVSPREVREQYIRSRDTGVVSFNAKSRAMRRRGSND